MKKTIIATVVFLTATLFSLTSASAFSCIGKPNVSMSLQSGTVTVTIGYGYWYLCSLNETKGGITPKVCEKIYNSLLLAEVTNTNAEIYFPSEAGNCQSIGSWTEPSVYEYHIDFLAGPAN
jgi:hypothetical protein